jgi:hypothetical protein
VSREANSAILPCEFSVGCGKSARPVRWSLRHTVRRLRLAWGDRDALYRSFVTARCKAAVDLVEEPMAR